MTKKSPSRIERDNQKVPPNAHNPHKANVEIVDPVAIRERAMQNNHCWDDLLGLHQRSAESLYVANSTLAESLGDKSIYPYFEHGREVEIAIRGITSDILSLSQELSNIYDLHKDRKGGFTHDDDLNRSIEIFQLYTAFHARYNETIIPNATMIAEAVQVAINRKIAAEASDTSVVTDVQVKESKQEEQVGN